VKRTPLKPGAPPRRSRKRITRTGKPRFKVSGDRNMPFREWLRAQRCLVETFECYGPIVVAHVRARGAGGVDVGNCVPLCDYHHFRQHMTGIKSWALHHGVDLKAKALEYAARWERERPQ